MKARLLQNPDLRKLMDHLVQTKVESGAVAHRVMLFASVYDRVNQDFTKKRFALIKEFGFRDPNDPKDEVAKDPNGNFIIDKQHMDAFKAGYEKLLEEDYAMLKLTAEDVKGFKDVSASDLKLLLDAGLFNP